MKITLHVWRQKNAKTAGSFETHRIDDVDVDSSFLEMLDGLNEELIETGKEPIAFDHDCREGICGMCGMVINGHAHGHRELTTTCQLHMREFNDGDEVFVEPWRAKAFPPIKDLVVDRSAFDRIIQAGGYVSVNTGSAQDANETPIAKKISDLAFDAQTCIGCGACVGEPTPRQVSSPPQRLATSRSCLRDRLSVATGFARWWLRWKRTVSVVAPTMGSARKPVRRESASTGSLA